MDYFVRRCKGYVDGVIIICGIICGLITTTNAADDIIPDDNEVSNLVWYTNVSEIVLHLFGMYYPRSAWYNNGGEYSCTQLPLTILNCISCHPDSVCSVQIVTHDGLIVCCFATLMIVQLSVRFATRILITIMAITRYKMKSLFLKCAPVTFGRQEVCLSPNFLISVDIVSAIYEGGNASSLQIANENGEISCILRHEQVDDCRAFVFVTCGVGRPSFAFARLSSSCCTSAMTSGTAGSSSK